MPAPTETVPTPMDLSAIPPLGHGSHDSIVDGCCIMEAVAFVAREPWSDNPACACPVISAFLRSWNDALPDEERDTLLRPLILRLVGTRSDAATERRRSLMAADWLVREYTPTWLRLAGLGAQADAVAGLPQITNMGQCPSLMPVLAAVRSDASAAWDAARDAAWDAARDAAGAAAGAAGWDAAWAAARDAAWDAAGAAAWAAAGDAAGAAAWAAAGDAARAAAWNAAGDAAGAAGWDAAWAAAWDALKPTRAALQQSALALVNRMIGAVA
jgi:hypothetical protein